MEQEEAATVWFRAVADWMQPPASQKGKQTHA